jgi:DNA replication protein DnaC
MVDRVLMDTNIPALFRTTLLDDYDTSRGDPRCYDRVEQWQPTDSKPALLLQGPPNKAKTMLAAALLNEYHHPFIGRVSKTDLVVLRQERLPIYFIHLAELIDLHLRLFRLHDLVMKGLREPTEYLEIDQLLQDLKSRVKVLVIDDVGKEHTTQTRYAEDAFDLLVRNRHNSGMTTIYTTNVPVTKWAYHYSDSMRSLIERSSRIVTFA